MFNTRDVELVRAIGTAHVIDYTAAVSRSLVPVNARQRSFQPAMNRSMAANEGWDGTSLQHREPLWHREVTRATPRPRRPACTPSMS
ncbi:hypothetical protein GCM10027451_49260 [Geodermatophilus aquaeductus]|uniref:Uncharacterized protein n=1 Tax=Geodermatophilus aquaeductus TaxID=1564161 RepID=A0A521FTG8_9ACTN|nr:hypothetical protein [Geodermatophilus aquaeductus]SMO99515.1 hypothetical protein SAMN06273567_11722 [Geodermatophilus aquaeductus]